METKILGPTFATERKCLVDEEDSSVVLLEKLEK